MEYNEEHNEVHAHDKNSCDSGMLDQEGWELELWFH